jgi:O-antigen ligase
MMGICAAGIAAMVYLAEGARRWGLRPYGVVAAVCLPVAVLCYAYLIGYFTLTPHLHNRFPVWRDTAITTLQKPVAGWGFGQFPCVMPLLTSPRVIPHEDRLSLYDQVEDKPAFDRAALSLSGGDVAGYYARKEWPDRIHFQAHNEYLQAAFALGLPGLLLLLLSCGSALARAWHRPDRIPFYGLLISAVSAFAFFSWQIVPISAVTIIYAGLCLRQEDVCPFKRRA